MTRPNPLSNAPPYAVQRAIAALGKNLKTARLRRNLSLADVAEKIGTSRRVIADAEAGKPTTGIAVYTALLWAYDLVEQLRALADPLSDREGLTLARKRERVHARRGEALDNDF